MTLPDLVNSLFELSGTAFIWLNIRRVLIDKQVKGVSIVTTTFFTSWSIWNLYFYQHLDQWLSFIASFTIGTMNIVYIYFLYKYRNGEPK